MIHNLQVGITLKNLIGGLKIVGEKIGEWRDISRSIEEMALAELIHRLLLPLSDDA